MKIPRDVSGDRLTRLLYSHGYEPIRTRGSHARLRHPGPPAHTVTVPLHHALRVGTLQAIMAEVADRRGLAVDVLISEL